MAARPRHDVHPSKSDVRPQPGSAHGAGTCVRPQKTDVFPPACWRTKRARPYARVKGYPKIDMPHAASAQSLSGQSPASSPSRSPTRALLAIDTPRLFLRAQFDGDPGNLLVTILLRPGLAEVGWMEFGLHQGPDRKVELGFFLDPTCRGRGLMREATRAALPQALRLLDARLLCATLPAGAPAAERIVHALGLVATSRRGARNRFEKDLCALI